MDSDSIKIEKLQEASQFAAWKFQVRVALMAKEIFNVVNGTEKKPAEPENAASDTAAINKQIAEWTKKDARAQNIIVSSLGQSMILHVLTCTTACEMWTKLHTVFEQRNTMGKQQLQQRFFS